MNMFEMLLNPRRSQRRPWELLFVGLFYASLAILLSHWIFSGDAVLSKYSGILVVTFTVMFCMPFVYYTIKYEESKGQVIEGSFRLLREHSKAIHAFLWLFIGLIIAFAFWYIVLGATDMYKAQIETYCVINSPSNYDGCVAQYGAKSTTSGYATSTQMLGGIFTNNLYVMIFTVVFSVIFGAGGIFILAWNASVISAAMVIFARSNVSQLPISLARYMIHGLPEIAAYFVGTLAGGIIGLSIVRKEFRTERFWNVLHDSLLLIISGIVLLVIAAIIEVFITPRLF